MSSDARAHSPAAARNSGPILEVLQTLLPQQGAARHLAPTGHLVTYGPYLEVNVPTAPGNLAFDASLRAQNPAWGIRALSDVARQAQHADLRLVARHALPANNLLLVWQHAAPSAPPTLKP